jgi:hypothetical protein
MVKIEPMKAITVWQPWATLLALGEKENETRSWATKHRGPLAIHAAKKIDYEACEREPIKSALAAHGYNADNLPTGVVLATCRLAECWEVSRCLRGGVILEKDGGNTMREDPIGEHRRFAWELADVKLLEKPISAKGQQGMWNWMEGL